MSRVPGTLAGLTAAVAVLILVPFARGDLAPGSFSGSSLVPGTDTSFAFHGFFELEVFHDLSARGADFYSLQLPLDAKGSGAAFLPAQPGHSQRGGVQVSAHESRASLETRTPTDLGELKTYVQLDLVDINNSTVCCSNSYVPRLRQAYASLGPVLVGKTWSTFIDLEALPDTIDPTLEVGVMGTYSGRVPQVRYTYHPGNGFSISAALENPSSEWTVGPSGAGVAGGPVPNGIATGTLQGLGGAETLPTVVAAGGISEGFFDATLHAMVQRLSIDSSQDTNAGVAPAGLHPSMTGWAVSAAGHYNTDGKDAVKATATVGQGVGAYLWDTASANEGLVWNPVTGQVSAPTAIAFTAAYEHYWTEQLRSNFSGGYTYIDRPSAADTWSPSALAGLTRYDFSTHVNVIWSPVPWTDLGLEWAHVEHVAWDGQSGNLDRLISMAKLRW